MGSCVSTDDDLIDIEPLSRDCDWTKWIIWKEKLFIVINNETLENQTLGPVLKKAIGPFGLEIIENFIFFDISEEQNFVILLHKLETFFYLRRFPRNDKIETIKEYIDRLQVIARNFGCQKPDIAVREKIVYDLNQSHFLEIITEMICIRNTFLLQDLNTNEIIFLINAYENQVSRVKRENFLQKLENKHTFRYNINCCGRCHFPEGTCPARGQRCYKCDGLNHFATACNKLYIIDCIYCGINHTENQCGAFGMQCSRCDGLFHFHWKCLPGRITFCQNCGNSHVDVDRKCSAFGKPCRNCGKIGHLPTVCRIKKRKSNSGTKQL